MAGAILVLCGFVGIAAEIRGGPQGWIKRLDGRLTAPGPRILLLAMAAIISVSVSLSR